MQVPRLVHRTLARDHRQRRERTHGDADVVARGRAQDRDPRLLGACDPLRVHARGHQDAALVGRDRGALERELAKADALAWRGQPAISHANASGAAPGSGEPRVTAA